MKRSSIAIILVVAVVLCPTSDALVTGASTDWEGIDWMTRNLLSLLYFLLVLIVYDLISLHR